MTDPCIYCRERKPFSAEHVVSAGIGGDDPAWLLTDCVCADCNTKVFSPLEAKVFRSSPLALSRIFLQAHTRTRTGKPSAPTMQPVASYHDEPGTGLLLEQSMQAGGKPVLAPQIAITSKGEIAGFVGDVDSGKDFIAAIEARLLPSITLVKKVREGLEVRFEVTTLDWNDETKRYQDTSHKGVAKAPREPVVWLEDMIWPGGVEEGDYTRLPPRIFRRDQGQIVCRVPSILIAGALLSVLHEDLRQIVIPEDAKPEAVKAQVHQRIAFDLNAYDRVLAKIGMNLCAKLFGAEFVRQTGFDPVRDYIRTGEGSIMKNFSASASLALGPALKDHHVMTLHVGPGADPQTQCLVFLCRFYGGQLDIFRLAELPAECPLIGAPEVVVVNYTADQITKMSLIDYAAFAVAHAA